jgi:prepilin-type N-terminal cleavage/methylation domain-containing protein
MPSIALRRNRAFSLIELVIVVVIIGIIAAIAIPRMSSATQSAGDSTLTGNLAVLRKAIDLYAAEHNNTFPTAANLASALTGKTDVDGTINASGLYGPYMRAIPALNVGTTAQRNNSIVGGTTPTAAGGWLYDNSAGTIKANLIAGVADRSGKDYNTY